MASGLAKVAIDTLPLSRALVPGLVNYRLGTVAKSLGLPGGGPPLRLADAQAVAHIFVHLLQLSRDIHTLSGLRQWVRSSAPSALQKLPLSDLPEEPGVYTFVDGESRVLLVGSADRLAPAARSVITGEHKGQKGLRTAVCLVERIEHEKARISIGGAAPQRVTSISGPAGCLAQFVNHSPRTPLAPEARW